MTGDVQEGQLWKAARNSYEDVGHAEPWTLGETYVVVFINAMGGKHEPLVAFKSPDDPNPMGGWEIKLSNFLKGFEPAFKQAATTH